MTILGGSDEGKSGQWKPEPVKPLLNINDPVIAPTLTGDQLARTMYPAESQFPTHLENDLNRLADEKGLSTEQVAAVRRENAQFLQDMRVPPRGSGFLHGLLVQHEIHPATTEQIHEWAVATRENMRMKYGKDAPARIAAANQYLARSPQLLARLQRTGLQSHPDIVELLVSRAPDLNSRT